MLFRSKPSRLVAAGPGDPRAMDPITGEMNYVEAPQMSEDPLLFQKEGDMTGVVDHAYIKMNKYTNLMSITPGGILQTIDKSFDDLGDVPKFFKQAIADGEIETGLSEYVPNVVLPKTVDELIDPSYYKSGRPIFADSAKVGGVIFIMGMPDFDRFQTVLGNFHHFHLKLPCAAMTGYFLVFRFHGDFPMKHAANHLSSSYQPTPTQ